MRFRFVVLIIVFWLAGCAQSATQPDATATGVPSSDDVGPATAYPIATAAVTSTNTVLPPQTETPTPTPVDAVVGRGQPFPEAAELRWEVLEANGHMVRRLAGLDLPLRLVETSPQSTWLAVRVQEAGSDTGRPDEATLIVDAEDDAHWWWDGVNSPYWLPDGRLLKVAQSGAVFVGQPGAWQDLEAPVPISFFPLVADGIGFAGAQPGDDGVLYRGLWRVDLTTKTWELAAPEMTTSRLVLAQDGSYVLALAFHEYQLWRVPVALNAPLDSATMQSVYNPLGSGGSPPPPTHLRNTTRWLVHRGAMLTEREADQGFPLHFGLLYDERDGRLVRFEDLPVTVPERYNFDPRYSASPSGEWLSVTLWAISDEPTQVASRALYVAPSNDLTSGHLVEGVEFVSWLTEPAAVIVRDVETVTLSLYKLPITADSRAIALNSTGIVIAKTPDNDVPLVPEPGLDSCWFCTVAYSVPNAIILRQPETEMLSIAQLTEQDEATLTMLEGAGEVLATMGASIVTTHIENPTQVLRFDVHGNLVDSLELPSKYRTIEDVLAVPATSSIYLSVTSEDGYALIEWSVD